MYDHHPASDEDIKGDFELAVQCGSCAALLLHQLHKKVLEEKAFRSNGILASAHRISQKMVKRFLSSLFN